MFAEMAGVAVPGDLSGHSLLPLLSQSAARPARPRPDWVLSEYHGCNANASTYMLREGQWKYITYADGVSVPPQLFGECVCPTLKDYWRKEGLGFVFIPHHHLSECKLHMVQYLILLFSG